MAGGLKARNQLPRRGTLLSLPRPDPPPKTARIAREWSQGWGEP
jgi:hypothetical protein